MGLNDDNDLKENKGHKLIEQGKYQEAIEYFDKTLKIKDFGACEKQSLRKFSIFAASNRIFDSFSRLRNEASKS